MSLVKQWDATKYQKTVNVQSLGDHVFNNMHLSEHNGKPLVIYDLGCGDGRNTELLLTGYLKHYPKENIKIIGIDYSGDMVIKALERFKELRDNGYDIQAYEGDAANVTFNPKTIPEHACDYLVSVSAFHWVKDAESLVKSIAKSLKKNGQLVCEFAWQSPPLVREAIISVMKEHKYSKADVIENDGWRRTDAKEWENLLVKNGFDYPDISIKKIARTQPLVGEDGMKDWLNTFVTDNLLKAVKTPEEKSQIIDEVCEKLKTTKLYKQGNENPWSCIYERLAINATYKSPDISAKQMANSAFGEGSFTAKILNEGTTRKR